MATAPGNRPAPPDFEPDVRIRVLALESSSQASWRLGAPERTLLLIDSIDRHPVLAEGVLELSLTGPTWSLSRAGSDAPILSGKGVLSVRAPRGDRAPIDFDGRSVGERLELVPRTKGEGASSTRFDLVSDLGIERYLPGVLQAELFGHWEPAAFEAQAIAARSFALCEAAYWGPRRHYDLVAGPASQAWVDLEAGERARAAVERTRGRVLLHEERVVPAYYSASCGGRGASAIEAISGHEGHRIGPLQAREPDGRTCCEAASVRDWSIESDADRLAKALRARGRSDRDDDLARIARPVSITVDARETSGRPLGYRLTDVNGHQAVIRADALRRSLGTLPRLDGSGPAALRSSDLSVRIRGGRVRITGRGFGHGVGLCQYGAQAMALEGADARTILERYYPEAKIEAAWSSAED